MLNGVDISWVQGNYQPGSEDFVIINASRANVGLVVGSQYRNQVANARAAGKHVGHYFFNGNADPTRCADFFVDNLQYQPGDSLWLDVESEPSTGTAAWSPAQALAFLTRVKARLGVVPGVYLNRSLMDGMDWSQVVALGAPLWIAYYNPSPPPIRWWPTWTVWQYTSTPMDLNRAQGASLAGLGATQLDDASKPKDDDMILNDNDRTVVWPNGYYNSYDQGVYNEIKSKVETGVESASGQGTFLRELWAANDFMAAREAQAVAGAIAQVIGQLGVGNGAAVNAQQIAADVVAALPKSYTVTANG